MNTMFDFHTALAFEILAAIAASFLIVVAANRTGAIKTFGTWAGSLGILFSITGMVCTGYYGIAYWQQGIYSPKSVASNQHMELMMETMMGSMQKMQGMNVPEAPAH